VGTTEIAKSLGFNKSTVVHEWHYRGLSRPCDQHHRRRDHYAQAVETLIAWVEFPYRIRRRTDDDPATLTGLAGLGHQLQERLGCQQAWIATECPPVAKVYAETRKNIGSRVGDATKEAWRLPPVTEAADMNLGDWGPGSACAPAITAFQGQVENRFGYRRVFSWFQK
jgi:hypothetical protein